ncbi:transposase [Actinomadura sp. 3N508]|uniref:transposase n=1 Tax=Actinomadura sp. 3N508 TaxID=3375153 RepID=UPI0037A233AA
MTPKEASRQAQAVSPKLRRKALELVESGRSVHEVAAVLGIAEACLHQWRSPDRSSGEPRRPVPRQSSRRLWPRPTITGSGNSHREREGSGNASKGAVRASRSCVLEGAAPPQRHRSGRGRVAG